ncbi:MAG: histidine phosphatase family protein [Mogibacterium sp.]|nr:histidine phosphatase family protein [Mogibacterium sp.]
MIYIIRHGQTEKNQAFVLQGRSDMPLNDTGIRQAEAAGEWFRAQGIRFDRVYSSPLGRAVRTAEIVAGGDVPVEIEESLIEMDYGPYEGMDLKKPAPEVLAFFKDFAGTPAPEGMEQLDSVVGRLGAFLERIREEAASGNVLIATHAIAMKGALEYLTPESRGSYWSKYIGNCAIYRAGCPGGIYEVPAEIEWDQEAQQ